MGHPSKKMIEGAAREEAIRAGVIPAQQLPHAACHTLWL